MSKKPIKDDVIETIHETVDVTRVKRSLGKTTDVAAKRKGGWNVEAIRDGRVREMIVLPGNRDGWWIETLPYSAEQEQMRERFVRLRYQIDEHPHMSGLQSDEHIDMLKTIYRYAFKHLGEFPLREPRYDRDLDYDEAWQTPAEDKDDV
jgi:hypothetical protein